MVTIANPALRRRARNALWPLLTLVALFSCLAYIFRVPLQSRFGLLFGDSGDALIEVSILQHWWNVLAGSAAWNQADFFTPYKDTIGYNDTYLIPAPFYVVARAVGADPLLAAMVSQVAMKAIGFAGMFAALRRAGGVKWEWAIVGAALFTTSNAALLQMNHGQLTHLGLVPWLFLFGWQAGRGLLTANRRGLMLNGAAFAILYGLFALSAFYLLWFFTFTTILFGLLLLALVGSERRSRLAAAIRAEWRTLFLLLLVGAVALLPFLLVYVPRFQAGNSHDWQTVYPLLPAPMTIFNVGPGNWLWGGLLTDLKGRQFPFDLIDGEQMVGFPIGSLIFTGAATVWAWRHRAQLVGQSMLAAVSTVAIITLLSLRVEGRDSLWHLVYALVPGAQGLRAISRFLLFATAVQFAVLAIWLDRFRGRWAGSSKLLIVVLLFAEQVQTQPPVGLDRPAQLQMLAEVAPIPKWCRAIFVISARTGPEIAADAARLRLSARLSPEEKRDAVERFQFIYRHNVDAMLIASVRGRPAINGFSTFTPGDGLFTAAPSAEMVRRARLYAHAHRVQGLCALDRRRSEEWVKIA